MNPIEYHWNYRLVRRRRPGRTFPLVTTYAIHEAHYNKHGHVWAISMNPTEVFGETLREARRSYAQQAEAFTKPVLDYHKIGKPKCKRCIAELKALNEESGLTKDKK